MAAASVVPTTPGQVVALTPEGHSAPSIPAKHLAWSTTMETLEDSHEEEVPLGYVNSEKTESSPKHSPAVGRRRTSTKSSSGPSIKPGLFGFADRESIKNRVRAGMLKERHKVSDFYHDKGIAQRIARHHVFDHVTLVVIALNAIWIWIDTDYNQAETLSDSDPAFQATEHLFCTYFTFEVLVRFAAIRCKRDGLKDGWFVFDSMLVVLMVSETWILLLVTAIRDQGPINLGGDTSVLRLVRLLRLSRLLRMMRSLPELMILVKGMLTAMRSVLYVICLLAIITYVFAIALTQLSKKTTMHETYFDHVPLAMYSLLVHGTFLDDLSGFCNDIRAESPVCLVLVFAFVAMACCTVMNMLIGVLCEVVSSTAATEKEEILTNIVSERMHSIVGSLDKDHDEMISYEEFQKIMNFPEALDALEEVGVDPLHIVDFAELFFFDDGVPVQQTFENFMEMVLDLRSSNTATVRDIKHLWLEMKHKITQHQTAIEEVKSQTSRINLRTIRLEEKMGQLLDQFQSISKALGCCPPSATGHRDGLAPLGAAAGSPRTPRSPRG